MRAAYIYGLLDPRTNALRYVGKSCDPILRHRSHIAYGRKRIRKGVMNQWIKDLADQKLEPELVLIEKIEGDWKEREIYWIHRLREEGYPLLNTSSGGIGADGEAPIEKTIKWWSPTIAPLGIKYLPKLAHAVDLAPVSKEKP